MGLGIVTSERLLDPKGLGGRASGLEILSVRECLILDLLMEHRSLKEIAGVLGSSVSAIDQRLRSAKRKLNTTDRNEAIRRYRALVAEAAEADREAAALPVVGEARSPPAPARQTTEEIIILAQGDDDAAFFLSRDLNRALDQQLGRWWRPVASLIVAILFTVLTIMMVSLIETLKYL